MSERRFMLTVVRARCACGHDYTLQYVCVTFTFQFEFRTLKRPQGFFGFYRRSDVGRTWIVVAGTLVVGGRCVVRLVGMSHLLLLCRLYSTYSVHSSEVPVS